MKARKPLFIFSILIGFSLVIWFSAHIPFLGELTCGPLRGGKWAPAPNRCVFRDCWETKNCLISVVNYDNCKSIQVGMTAGEVAFHFGMPLEVMGDSVVYHGSKPDGVITTIFKNDRLMSIDCDPKSLQNQR